MVAINRKKILLLNCLLFVGSLVLGHALPSTKIVLQIEGGRILAKATMPADELNTATKSQVNIDQLDTAGLIQYFQNHIHIESETQSWNVRVKSFDSFEEDDSKHGGHHGIIPFLIMHFELIPSDGNVLESFVFDYDAILHEVRTHDVEVFQEFQDDKNSELGELTMNTKTESFEPLEIQLQQKYEPKKWWLSTPIILLIPIGYFIYRRSKVVRKNNNPKSMSRMS